MEIMDDKHRADTVIEFYSACLIDFKLHFNVIYSVLLTLYYILMSIIYLFLMLIIYLFVSVKHYVRMVLNIQNGLVLTQACLTPPGSVLLVPLHRIRSGKSRIRKSCFPSLYHLQLMILGMV